MKNKTKKEVGKLLRYFYFIETNKVVGEGVKAPITLTSYGHTKKELRQKLIQLTGHLLQQERDRVIEEVEKLEKDLNEYTQGATQPCYGVAIEDLSTLKKRNKEC